MPWWCFSRWSLLFFLSSSSVNVLPYINQTHEIYENSIIRKQNTILRVLSLTLSLTLSACVYRRSNNMCGSMFKLFSFFFSFLILCSYHRLVIYWIFDPHSFVPLIWRTHAKCDSLMRQSYVLCGCRVNIRCRWRNCWRFSLQSVRMSEYISVFGRPLL